MMPKTSAGGFALAAFAPRFPHAYGKAASRGEGRSKKMSRAIKPSGRLLGSNANTAAWSSAANVWPRASMRFSRLL